MRTVSSSDSSSCVVVEGKPPQMNVISHFTFFVFAVESSEYYGGITRGHVRELYTTTRDDSDAS